jgi:cell wall-associated NlpC family hydrolase
METSEARKVFDGLVARSGVSFKSCLAFVRYGFGLFGIELPENVYEASKDFSLVEGRAQFMDIVVFNSIGTEYKRHAGLMLDSRWMIHFSKSSGGVARAEITRDQWRFDLLYIGRHKAFANND